MLALVLVLVQLSARGSPSVGSVSGGVSEPEGGPYGKVAGKKAKRWVIGALSSEESVLAALHGQ